MSARSPLFFLGTWSTRNYYVCGPTGLALAMGFAVRALVTSDSNPSLAHWMLLGPSHQPHVAEEVPQDALRNEHQPIANQSDILLGDDEVKQPLMVDQQRQLELENQLNHYFIGKPTEINTIASLDLIKDFNHRIGTTYHEPSTQKSHHLESIGACGMGTIGATSCQTTGGRGNHNRVPSIGSPNLAFWTRPWQGDEYWFLAAADAKDL
ncbi:hypothetical protein NE237_009604 [Protea cynaroides]|uniref:Uncharacterized protein n=1 Tax=Protea cynaroides TaxID=273540 RepID=A0A9Q0R0T4_9MAGN|nr:hypothetical protein NE237_009604 [Protea cynaroides]